jgi:hypothetical protein
VRQHQAGAISRRHPLLAVRLWLVWTRGLRARDAVTLEALRSGSRPLRRVVVPPGRVGVAELEFDDGRVVRLTGVYRPVAVALETAVSASFAELIEGAHPGPVWALYFVVGGDAAGRLPLLAVTAEVRTRGEGGIGTGAPVPEPPRQLTPA